MQRERPSFLPRAGEYFHTQRLLEPGGLPRRVGPAELARVDTHRLTKDARAPEQAGSADRMTACLGESRIHLEVGSESQALPALPLDRELSASSRRAASSSCASPARSARFDSA